MSKVKLVQLDKTTIELVDGDRGVNYPNKKDLSNNGYCLFLDSSNLTENGFIFSSKVFITETKDKSMGKGKLNRGDLVMNTRGTLGNIGLYNEKILYNNIRINSGMLIIRGGEEYDQYFLYSFFRSNIFISQVINLMSGSVQKQLPIWIFNFINVPKIEIIEQKKISKVIGLIDSKIELNNKINTELEKMAKTLYDYWFIQFDFPDENGKPYKSSGGKMVWSDELKREIPEGWGVEKISKIINLDKSGDWGKESNEGNYNKQVLCIRGTDLNGLNGKGELNSPMRYILEKNIFKILEHNDLIIEISGGSPTQSTGRLSFITKRTLERFNIPLICSNFCRPIGLKNKKFLYNFVYYWNNLYENGIFFGYEGKTSGIKNLLLESFIETNYIIVPKENIINNFYNKIESINNTKQQNLKENQKLAELRDWLLPMLMNGQVSVK